MDLNFLIPKKFVGLYINRDFVEVAIAKKDMRNTVIEKVVQRKIAIQDIDVVDQNEIIRNALEDLFTENKIPRNNVILNLPTQDVVVRTFSMPRLHSKKEWFQAVRFEGQKYVPFRIEEISIDFVVLNPDEETEEMDILFVCAKPATISRYISILNLAGISCFKLGSVFLSMVRACLHRNLIDEDQPTLIMSVKKKFFGRERIRCLADMLLVYKGSPVVARDISVVSSENDVDEKFFNEVFLSVKLFNSALSNVPIQNVIMLDGISLYKWDDFFEENFAASVRGANFSEALDIEATDGVSLGAALAEIFWPRIDVNLLKDTSAMGGRVFQPFPVGLMAVRGGVLMAIILGLILGNFYLKGRKLDKKIKQRTEQIGSLGYLSLDDLKKQKKEVALLKKFLRPFEYRRIYMGDLMNQILTPFVEQEKIWVEKFRFFRDRNNKKNLELHGAVYTGDSVEDILLINKVKKSIEDLKDYRKKLPAVILKDTAQRNYNLVPQKYTGFTIVMNSNKRRS